MRRDVQGQDAEVPAAIRNLMRRRCTPAATAWFPTADATSAALAVDDRRNDLAAPRIRRRPCLRLEPARRCLVPAHPAAPRGHRKSLWWKAIQAEMRHVPRPSTAGPIPW